MSENRGEVVAGALVLAVAVGFLAWAAQGRSSVSGETYALKAAFRSVEGVTIGTDVRLAGVKVGSVTALSLNPQSYFADAVISVQKDVILPSDSAALVSSEGLLGGAFIELQPGGMPDALVDGDEIEDTQGAVSVVSLMMKFAGGGEEKAEPAADPSAETPIEAPIEPQPELVNDTVTVNAPQTSDNPPAKPEGEQ